MPEKNKTDKFTGILFELKIINHANSVGRKLEGEIKELIQRV